MVHTLALELAPIRVNALDPAVVGDSPAWSGKAEVLERFIARTPTKKLATKGRRYCAAMIVGMIPMAIGGAGEEQNAALARAVIGGLLFAVLRKRNDGVPAYGVFEELPNE